jgi:hypothetical protein
MEQDELNYYVAGDVNECWNCIYCRVDVSKNGKRLIEYCSNPLITSAHGSSHIKVSKAWKDCKGVLYKNQHKGA